MAEPYEHPALPPDAGPHAGSVGGRRPGPGTVLQQSLPAVAAASAAASTAAVQSAQAANQPEWWKALPNGWRMFIQLGFMGLFVGVFVIIFWDFRTSNQRSERLMAEQQASFLVALQGMQSTFRAEVDAVRTRADARNEKLVSEYHALVSENRNLSNELRRLADALYLTNQEMRQTIRELPKKKGPDEEQGRFPPAPRPYSQPATTTGVSAAIGARHVPATTAGGGSGTGELNSKTTAGGESADRRQTSVRASAR